MSRVIFASAAFLLLLLGSGAGTHALQSSTSGDATATDPISVAIAELYNDIKADQYQDSLPTKLPFQLGYQKGRYKNSIHLNFIGNETQQFLRNEVGIPDNNMFVTQFVAEALIETGMLNRNAPINDTQIQMGIESSLRNKDKRFPDDVPIFGFWEQEWKECLEAGGLKAWRQWAIVMSPLLDSGRHITAVLKAIFDALHLEKLEKFLKPFSWIADTFYTAFNIPPDCDDTSTMIAFTHWLYELKDVLPESAKTWDKANFNLSKAYDQIVETAYCPNTPNLTSYQGATDTRSYYWARDFIENLTEPNDCLVATWIETFEYMNSVYEGMQGGPINPLNANNLDSSVAANTLYGMTVALVHNESAWFTRPDGRGRALYLTTAKFVAWALANQPNIKRTDLQMLYYPAVINFPYFVTRHLRLLESIRDSFPFPELEEVRQLLRSAVNSGGTAYITGKAKLDSECGAGNASSPVACWDGFLGHADTNNAGEPTPHYDDRFYTTAVAVNALIDGYTFTNANASFLNWTDNVPSYVKNMVSFGSQWLLNNYNNKSTSLANTFFSGSVKSKNGIMIWTPPNYVRDMHTGHVYGCANMTFQTVINMTTYPFWVVNGVVPHDEYETMLREGCGQCFTWTHMEGYNSHEQQWPFWSAPVLSRAYAMLAFAKVRALDLM